MCVIIEKFETHEIPFANLKSASEVNTHGWGATIYDRGKLETVKVYDEKGNDPEKIAKFLEQAKDLKAIVHMRIQTAGLKDIYNCHPFDVLEEKKDGLDVKFFHNGTMSEFCDYKSDFSDTFWFSSKILKPLFSRWAQTDEADAVLKSPVLRNILGKYSNGINVFTLIDSFGNIMHINKEKGEEYDWGWASNRYAFRWATKYNKDDKKEATTAKGQSYIARGGALVPFVSQQSGPSSSLPQLPKAHGAGNDNKLNGDILKAATKIAEKVQENKELFPMTVKKADGTEKVIDRPYLASPQDRQSFKELTNIQSLRELCWLEDQELVEFICRYPDLSALMVMDLLWELYSLNPKGNA